MIPKECKRLAEVDFPIAAVSRHAVKEKSPQTEGHPSGLHLWWARRPLASSRAMLMTLLLPDPCDQHCPEIFKEEARRVLLDMDGRSQGWKEEVRSDEGLRQVILRFIADFANWENAAKCSYLDTGRALVKAAYGEDRALVVDPFAGGGSIPLEALRLGCDAFASDLNPVACLILKTMLEDIPCQEPKLTDELREVVAKIKRMAAEKFADLYPNDPDGATPIAYLWARTVRCEAPNCGAEIPLMRSFWLCNKKKRKIALRHSVERFDGAPPQPVFEIFQPTSTNEVHAGTVTRAKATCLCCGAVLPPERVRPQLADTRGGADTIFNDHGERVGGARMMAVVTSRPNEKGRYYRLPTEVDYVVVHQAHARITEIIDRWEHDGMLGFCPIPDEPLPPIGTLGFRVQRYGMLQWGDLFTARQKVALVTLVELTKELTFGFQKTLVSLLLGKMADGNNSLSRWESGAENPVNLYARQAIPIVWDFCESTPMSNARGVFLSSVDAICKVIDNIRIAASGTVQPADAADHPLPDQSAGIWFTDPPYYDAIPYADLSDFFLVWHKRVLPDHPLWQRKHSFDQDDLLSPKVYEAVQDKTKQCNGRSKDRKWFEETMAQTFSEGRRILTYDGIGSVVFAHKTTEGWEALLSGMIQGGWTVTGSWPIATESATRLRARNSAALATSVHLICRPRSEDAPIGDWANVLHELPVRVTDWMERLQREDVRGADLVFACIGPALEIFSRYCVIETAEGQEVGLSEYLEKVWEVVGRAALEQILGAAEATAQNGMASVLEEDARLTALFLWTLQSTETFEEESNEDEEDAVAEATVKGFKLPFDVVRRFSQPMGIDLARWANRIVDINEGVVRLLPMIERAKVLFGEKNGVKTSTNWIGTGTKHNLQPMLFSELDSPTLSNQSFENNIFENDFEFQSFDSTVLDRVHIAMLLQANGHANDLRNLIATEQERGPDFLRLSNALSALYPRVSQEKRLLDAMLLGVPR